MGIITDASTPASSIRATALSPLPSLDTLHASAKYSGSDSGGSYHRTCRAQDSAMPEETFIGFQSGSMMCIWQSTTKATVTPLS